MKKVTLILLLNIGLGLCASTKKKSTDSAESTNPPGPAILAIEIVNGNDNSTDVRNNTKRTIESALGYGFQGNYYTTNQGKKYMVYPYSQRDIPARNTKSDASKYLSQTLNIQKSVSYNVGSKLEPAVHTGKQLFSPVTNQAYVQHSSGYYPSTLFSTVGQTGQIGGLTTHIPTQSQSASSVPVIILRVYSNQLSDNAAIYPNLPQTHPYANNLNSVNLQSILANYLQQQYYQAQQAYKPIYQAPNVAYQGQDYGYQGQMDYQGQNVEYQGQNLLYQDPNIGYHQLQQGVGAYQQQQQQQEQQPQVDYKALEQNAADLPTHENYPDDAHTRVIYHGPKGHIQGVSYSASSQDYKAPHQRQSQSQTQSQSQAPNSQYVYTDAHGQSYIYVKPSQLQSLNYYQQDYQQQNYPNEEEHQQPEQQNYQTSYQEDVSKNRQYLPVPESASDKVYNYHSQPSKQSNDRAKKSSGSPVTFESQKLEMKTKRNM